MAMAAVFALLHGAGNGMITIAKGTLPLALFGSAGYGLTQGWLGVGARITQAAAPYASGVVLELLGGRAFLHSYDWRQDAGFGTLELILTAPVVVASWISLQYYGSVVAPQAFGGGNKLLHNVVGGFGVLEGHSGAPRVGLPWQSVHDGRHLQHDPLRLAVLVEAPADAVTAVLARHETLCALFDNGWLHLLRLDDQGRIADRYTGGLRWQDADDGLLAA